jgi:osmotically-inducible protein OsmY
MEVKSQTVEISVINTDTAADAKIINDSKTVTISANTKTLLQALQEEGIAPIDNVKIQITDGKITVNGKALSAEQNAKFSSYLKKD